jgi:hypothetical protein
MARAWLTAVGLLYAGLAAWCTWDPLHTSRKVGFELQPGAGQSEFVTVYGGLELALALIFLAPWVRPAQTAFALQACLLTHGCLVAFRSLSFAWYGAMPSMTQRLAIGEWVIFLVTAAICWRQRTIAPLSY